MASPTVIDRPVDWPQNVTLTGVVTGGPRQLVPGSRRRELGALLSDDRYRQNAVAVQTRLTREDGLSESARMVDLILRG